MNPGLFLPVGALGGTMPTRASGGILLNAAKIQETLSDPNVFGIALYGEQEKPEEGVAVNVFKVFFDMANRKLCAEPIENFPPSKGSRMDMVMPGLDPKDYEFEFRDEMDRSKFDFGFITRGQLEPYFSFTPSVQSFFISAVMINFGKEGKYVNEHFSFKIMPYPMPKLFSVTSNEELAALIEDKPLNSIDLGTPIVQVSLPCPPNWEDLPNPGSNEGSFYRLINAAIQEALSQ